jgi:hypothetical protein
MGVVEDFYKSDEVGINVTDEEWNPLLTELLKFPNVILAVSGTTAILYNKKYVTIKVKEKANGSPIE